MTIFKPKILNVLPPPDARAPVKVSVSGQLRWFSWFAQTAGVGALTVLFWHGGLSTQLIVSSCVVVLIMLVVKALYTGIFKPLNATDIIAFGIHAAARPDNFDTPDSVSAVLTGAAGTVATVAKKEQLEIFVQTRAGQILHGQLSTTQFVAPFFTCVRFRIFTETVKRPWLDPVRQMVLLPDNIDAEEFRQCRVLLRWT